MVVLKRNRGKGVEGVRKGRRPAPGTPGGKRAGRQK